MTQNALVWKTWIENFTGLVKIDATMAGAIYTLNLDFLRFLFENEHIDDRMFFYRKIKAVFDVWRVFQEKGDNPNTQAALKRAKELQRG